jgi:prephenate dehydratase/prephenate dehydrogenase
MTREPTSETTELVVVGAAGALGRWVGQHVLAQHRWGRVHLLDAAASVTAAADAFAAVATTAHVVTEAGPPPHALDGLAAAPAVLACVAVPAATLPGVARWLLPALPAGAVVAVLGNQLATMTAELNHRRPDVAVVGVHCLFGTTVERADGQIFAVSPDPRHPHAHRIVSALVESVGGAVNVVEAARHDDLMRYIQTATHQALLTFADVIGRSGYDLDADLWANRTPVFELMMALAGRVLAPGQEATTAAVQSADADQRIAGELTAAGDRLHALLDSGVDPDRFADYLAGLRAPFPGALFTKVQQAGTLATAAVQGARARIARHRTHGEVIGVISSERAGRLHVGTVESVTGTSFVLRDALVGRSGRAGLLIPGAAAENTRRLGVGGSPRSVEFTLGRVRILTPDELEAELGTWLGSVTRGCKFLIPEAIAGISAVEVARGVHGVDDVELVSEEVRLGQRECVVRLHARVDRDLALLEREVQRRIDDVFVWPDGVVLPWTGPPVERVGYLGPAGTFSDTAAQQLARLLGHPGVERIERPDFASLVGALVAGEVDVAVVPITNSSSGLVDLAAAVLATAPAGALVAGGVVDVPVRFDAYVAPGTTVAAGSTVLSHPQGFRQCSSFIAAMHFVEEVCTSTVEACHEVLRRGAGVALAARGVGEELGLELHRASVGNLAGALTRFLVLGRSGAFGPPPRGDVTERAVWLLEPGTVPSPTDQPCFDELLRGPSGRALLVSSRSDRLAPGTPGATSLGTIPWSPRTPIVVL